MMIQDDSTTEDPARTSSNSPPAPAATPTVSPLNAAAVAPSAEHLFKEKKPHRTPGLRILDAVLYGVFTNAVVFITSVAATYLTMKGRKTDELGKVIAGEKLPHGKWGAWFFDRGEPVINFIKNRHIFKDPIRNQKFAENGKMVAFSFIDGSLAALGVKFVENRREQIAQWIDRCLSTEPKDHSVYDAEPKQSWTSVGLGRVAAFSVVLPVYFTLNQKFFGSSKNINELLFTEPGNWSARKLKDSFNIEKLTKKIAIRDIMPIAFFETFYTLLCTASLYVFSRGIARLLGEHAEHKAQKAAERALQAGNDNYPPNANDNERTPLGQEVNDMPQAYAAAPAATIHHINAQGRIDALEQHRAPV